MTLALLLALALQLQLAPAAAQTLADFTAEIYPTVLPAYPCTKLLNRTHPIGCENPVPQVQAPMLLLRTAAALGARADALADGDEPPMLVLPYDVFADDDTFDAVDRIAPAGILVLAPEAGPVPSHFSPADQDPQRATGLYGDLSPSAREEYAWNPLGTGVSHRFFRFPIYFVGRTAVDAVVQRCKESAAQEARYPRWAAKVILTMQAQTNSLECLDAQSCMPLTGQSVLSVIGPRAAPETDPIILAVATLDSTSFFHGDWTSREDQLSPGGGAEIAGAIATVVAARALQTVVAELGTPIAFALFSAETWGRLGSRHLAACTTPTSPAGVNDCPDSLPNMAVIREAIGVGGISEETVAGQFYAHIDSEAVGQDGAAATDLQAALVGIDGAGVLPATLAPQRLPTSPVETFARQWNTTSLVIAGHNDTFTNRFYHSELDRSNNTAPATVCSLATALARSLHVRAGAATSALDADCEFTQQLIDCLLGDFSCPLAQDILDAADVNGTPPHYVMIRRDPTTVSPLEGFMYGLMARETAVSTSEHACTRDQDCRDAAIGAPTGTERRLCVARICLVSDSQYVDAHSNALNFNGNTGRWEVDELELSKEPDEPLWTESDWHSDLGVTLYLQGDPALERTVLLVGVGWAVLCIAAVYGTWMLTRTKQD